MKQGESAIKIITVDEKRNKLYISVAKIVQVYIG